MYLFIVAALMFVLPIGSVALQSIQSDAPAMSLLMLKWFVIWSVGARLFLAGVRQIVQPRYTAEVILQLKHAESLMLVRELGFANLAIGSAGLASAFMPAWSPAVALAGGIFYGLAGANHLRQSHRGKLENIAMVSDLFVGAILLVCLAMSLV
ncbi:MAG TPA: DUF6790 family protein [Steroidobacteraceae bacterium]|nr:DUF6790 family protein [Steroidobacteraceae bacterium]